MQNPAIPANSSFYAKLGELSTVVEKYADCLKENKGRQDQGQEKKDGLGGGGCATTKAISVREILATAREGIPKKYKSLISVLEPCKEYEIVELADYLPEDKEKRRVFLGGLQLPFKGVVSAAVLVAVDACHIDVRFHLCVILRLLLITLFKVRRALLCNTLRARYAVPLISE
jgi:hypothetical protein